MMSNGIYIQTVEVNCCLFSEMIIHLNATHKGIAILKCLSQERVFDFKATQKGSYGDKLFSGSFYQNSFS